MSNKIIYGYVDEAGFIYPPSAGAPFEDSVLEKLTPVTDRADFIRHLKRLERRPPHEFTQTVGTITEAEQRAIQEEMEAADPANRGVAKAAQAALAATNVEGQTAPNRKPQVRSAPSPKGVQPSISAPTLTGNSDDD